MIGSVQILKNNGESLVSNGLAHFKFNDTDKQYVIYTLGEQINELLKIYIGYENAPVTDPGISDDDSAKITELLKKIGKNEDVSSIITILPLTAGLYHIHDKVKKVALQTSAFNNIINAQQRGQIKALNKNEPIVKENTFFDPSVINEELVPTETAQEQSIFDNPMQPVLESVNTQSTPVGSINTNQDVQIAQEQAIVSNPEKSEIGQMIGQDSSNIIKENIEKDSSPMPAIPDTIESDQSDLENKNISDEEAKNAILAVEAAQATIKENIAVIKEFIKQQKNKTVSKTIDTSSEINEVLGEDSSETPSMSSTINSLPSQYDVVNNLELAPQPEISDNVLGNESDLDNGYLIDTSVNQLSSEVNTGSIVDTSVAIPQTDLSQQIPAQSQPELTQPAKEMSTKDVSAVPEIMTQAPLKEQQLPEVTSLPNENQSEMIDTMAMIPGQSELNASPASIAPVENSSMEMLNTNNMPMPDSSSTAPSMIDSLNATATQKAENIVVNSENLNLTGTIMGEEKKQNDVSSQNIQNGTIDIQIPDVEIEGQFVVPSPSSFVQEQVSDSTVSSGNELNSVQQQDNSLSAGGGEFAIPQIDMNVSTMDQSQAPVVMPDGQSQEVNQGLVLTPDAFNKAA